MLGRKNSEAIEEDSEEIVATEVDEPAIEVVMRAHSKAGKTIQKIADVTWEVSAAMTFCNKIPRAIPILRERVYNINFNSYALILEFMFVARTFVNRIRFFLIHICATGINAISAIFLTAKI